jgi:hypothetical protein
MCDKSMVSDDLIETRRAIYAQPGFADTMKRIMCLQEMEIRQPNMITARPVWSDAAAGRQPVQPRSWLNASTALCIRHQMIERAVVGQRCVNGLPVPNDDTIGLSA